MARKSNDWLDDDSYWNESNQIAFEFEEDEAVFASNKKGSISYSAQPEPKRSQVQPPPKAVTTLNVPEGNEQIKRYLTGIQANKSGPKEGLLESAATPKDLVDRILNGQDHYVYSLKSKEDKLLFLDNAIKVFEGNAITTAVLFLQQTLSPKIFNNEVSKRPEAVNHYANYLESMGRLNELVDFLTMLGRYEEAAMAKYRQAAATTSVETKIKNMKGCQQNHFSGFVGSGFAEALDFWESLISEQISSLERQLPIELEDKRQEGDPHLQEKFLDIPRQPLVNMPVITTLFYCCLHHYELPENYLASPVSIRKAHNLSDKQYIWTALLALAMRRKWGEIDTLFEYKTWFRSKKVKSCLKFYEVVKILKKFDAPEDTILKYFNLVDDDDQKLSLAKEFGMNQLAIDMYVSLRDRSGLQAFALKLNPESTECLYAQNMLRTSTIKWKS